MADDLVVMGRVVAPYGIRGWIRVQPFTGSRAALLDYPAWWLVHDGRGEAGEARVARSCRVIEARLHGDGVVALLEGVGDREAAQAWKGAEVRIPRADLPAVADNEVYWSDLVGCRVLSRENVDFGVVESVQDNGAQPLLVVAEQDGVRRTETLIPFVPAIVDEVDLETMTITVDWAADA